MKTVRNIGVVIAGAVALGVPAASIAATPPPTAKKLDVQMCKQIRAQVGKHTFRQTYRSFAGCLRQTKAEAKQDIGNAAQTCKSERDDPNFADSHGGKSFNEYYGSNTKAKGKGAGANAFGKCVSTLAKQNAQDDVTATVAAAANCKSERKSDPGAFADKYGSGPKHRNAFGKCVAQQAKAKQG